MATLALKLEQSGQITAEVKTLEDQPKPKKLG
jgi:hypothetical protein